MKTRMNGLRQTLAPAIPAGIWAVGCLAFATPDVSSPASTVSAYPETHTISLEYQECGQSLMSWGLSVSRQSEPFKQEPPLGQSMLRRGRLRFGAPSPQDIAFIWDSAQGKLYLDLNRNDDLTDDPDGVFTRASKGSGRFQAFKDVRLSLATDAGQHRLLLDLDLREYRNSVRFSAKLRSYWAGKVTLNGRDWQLGLVEKPYDKPGSAREGYLLLRPWEARNENFSPQEGALEAFPFPDNLFFQGQAYRVECAAKSQEGEAQYQMQLVEQPVTLGELRFAGEFVRRLVLKEGPYAVVLDEPAGTVQVPVGTYGGYRIQVQKGEALACPDVWPREKGISRKLVAEQGKTLALTAGGPLTNSVMLHRRGRMLRLDYRVFGADGAAYHLAQRDSRNSKPPQFTVYQGDKKLASGRFQFG